jgi:hypothetical protein
MDICKFANYLVSNYDGNILLFYEKELRDEIVKYVGNTLNVLRDNDGKMYFVEMETLFQNIRCVMAKFSCKNVYNFSFVDMSSDVELFMRHLYIREVMGEVLIVDLVNTIMDYYEISDKMDYYNIVKLLEKEKEEVPIKLPSYRREYLRYDPNNFSEYMML